MNAPQVSVLLPTHNRADVLGYAIRSVLAQRFGDFELLIVGDGCTDATRDVVAQFGDPRIKWFDLPKAPLSGYANRNIVLHQAVGRVIAYAQHDDLWFPDHLELLLATLDRGECEWVYSRPLWVGPDGVICPSAVNLTLGDELSHFLNVENNIPSSCVMHLRAALQRIGYWPEDQAQIADWICWQRIIRNAARPVAGYCQVPTNLHFRAIWRDHDTHIEATWRPLATSPWWPAALTNAAASEPEQAVIWRAMRDVSGWVDLVRDATRTVLDRMAWNAIRDLLPDLAYAQAAQAAVEIEARQAEAQAHAARLAAQQALTMLQQERDVFAVRLAELKTQQQAALEQACQSLMAQAERDRTALQLILASRIWRMTRPVRGAVDAVRKATRSPKGRTQDR